MRSNPFTSWKRPAGYLLLFMVSVGLLALAFQRIFRDNAIGADFFIYWRAARAVFSEGLGPYDAEVTQSIQMGIYGRLAEPEQDQVAFAYPAYALYWIWPFAGLDFTTAQAIWLALFLVAWLAAGVWLAQAAPALGGTLIFFYPLAFGLLLGNFNILVGLALLIFFGLLLHHPHPSTTSQVISGMCLSLALVKPQLSWLLLLFAGLVLLRRRRWAALIAFTASAVSMTGSSFLAFPGWLDGWLSQSRAYNVYIPPEALLVNISNSFFLPPFSLIVAYAILASMIILTAILYIRWLRQPIQTAFSGDEIRLLAWSAWVTYLLHPWPKSYEQIVLLIPLLVWTAGYAKSRPWLVGGLWVVGLALSWWALADNLNHWTTVGIYAWPVLYFTVWLIIVWYIKPVTAQRVGISSRI